MLLTTIQNLFTRKQKLIKNPPVGTIQWGDFRRVNPISRKYGFDRGGPIDRYYIKNFLARHSNEIKGRVLEIGDNNYTKHYGGKKVDRSDILHVHSDNPKATFVGDLTDAEHVPSNAFDCVVLTQTLHLIYDYKKALQTCYRLLKPGGSLLLTVPGISQIEDGEWGKNWLWSFTERSMELIFKETFPEAETEIEKFGNVLSASAFLYGLGVNEVTKKELDFIDPLYQVLITVKATKKAEQCQVM
ncbi:MAG: class I SAM-dependent methyltransferase [Balneolales bacterium]